jgi:hypothetical protein
LSTLPASFGPVNDSSADRDILLSGLRLAATRSRLKTTLFETLHIALRQRRASCGDIIRRLRDEGVLAEVPFHNGEGNKR